jgi:crotonobetainyl-CoA:carnitine CoA-transferase CaiB-like acyl-CoA transferase
VTGVLDGAGVLDGVRVLDLSWGIAGPMTGMLLADHGASVTKIEPPGGDPSRALSGAGVWNRGKRSAVLDLATQSGRDTLLALADRSDVLLESYAPGTTARLGIDYATVHARNPRLVYCSITAYGRDTADADRPGYDALVAARTGLQWEQRGWIGGTPHRVSGAPALLPDLDTPEGCHEGTAREGPIFPYSAFPSLGAFFLATTAISAALRAREVTGRGQWVETSLLHGVLAGTGGGWQRAERADAAGYETWVLDPRSIKGLFRTADGWVYHWVPRPNFVLGEFEGRLSNDDPARIATNPEELIVLHHYFPLLAEQFRSRPTADWLRAAAGAGVTMQPVRTPEEALADPALLEDGCVVAIDGARQVGSTYRLSACPTTPSRRAPAVGEHDDEVRAEASAPVPATPVRGSRPLSSPLAGIRVLDLGLAVAGPFGTQILSDLGADVIKINALHDGFWHATHIAMACNRGKRSLAVNLKDERGLAVLHQLVADADVVHHNMRYDAAVRLGVDYETLRAINPALVYCHTRAFDRSRDGQPGNDQTAAALAGVTWEDGGCGAGGRPLWSTTGLGDLGNGFLSAIGVIQALYHRDRTGEGQFVDTSILYACLLNTSYASLDADGNAAARPHLDGEQLGISPYYRLYETAEGWLCLAAVTDDHRRRLAKVMNGDGDDLVAAFRARTAAEWFELLDGAGVPCEISTPDFVFDLLDDPGARERQWIVEYDQPLVGRLEHFGLLFDFSETPGRIAGPPLMVGDHSRAILTEAGLAPEAIDVLIADGVVLHAGEVS